MHTMSMQQTRWKVGSARMRAAQYKPTQASLADFAHSAQKVKASKDEAVLATAKGGTKGNWEFVCEGPMAAPPPRRQDSETAFMPDAETMDTSASLTNLQEVVDVDMLPGLSDELLAQVAGDVLDASTDLDTDALHTDALHAFDEHLAVTTGGGRGGEPLSLAAPSASPNSRPSEFASVPPAGACAAYNHAQVTAAFEQAAALEHEAALDEASALLGEDALIDFDCLALAPGGGGNTLAAPPPPPPLPPASLASECARLATQCGGDFGGEMMSATQDDSGFSFSLLPEPEELLDPDGVLFSPEAAQQSDQLPKPSQPPTQPYQQSQAQPPQTQPQPPPQQSAAGSAWQQPLDFFRGIGHGIGNGLDAVSNRIDMFSAGAPSAVASWCGPAQAASPHAAPHAATAQSQQQPYAPPLGQQPQWQLQQPPQQQPRQPQQQPKQEQLGGFSSSSARASCLAVSWEAAAQAAEAAAQGSGCGGGSSGANDNCVGERKRKKAAPPARSATVKASVRRTKKEGGDAPRSASGNIVFSWVSMSMGGDSRGCM